MLVVNVEQIDISLSTIQTSNTATLTDTIGTLANAVVFASWEMSNVTGEISSSECECDFWLSDTSTLNIQRNDTKGSITATCFVVEFDSSVTVQKGTFSISSSGETDDITLTAVVLADSFAWGYARMDESSISADDSDPNHRLLTFDLTTTTNLQVERVQGSGAVNGHYYVVEDAGNTVNNFESIHDNGVFTETATFSPAVTLAETFLVTSQRSTESRYNDEAVNTIKLSSTTQVEMRDLFGSTEDDTFVNFIVSNSALDVQHFNAENTGSLSATQTITSVDRTYSIVKPTIKSGHLANNTYTDGNLDSRYVRYKFNSDTQVEWSRGQGALLSYHHYDVIEFPAAPIIHNVTVSESVDVTDDKNKHSALRGKQIKSALDTADSLIHSFIGGRQLIDPIDTSDNLNRLADYFKTTSDQVVIDELLQTGAERNRIVKDKIQLSDNLVRFQFLFRQLTDYMGVSEELSKSKILTTQFQDNININDELGHALIFVSGIIEKIDVIDDIPSAFRNVMLDILESITISEDVEIYSILLRSVQDVIGIEDSILHSTLRNGVINDDIVISEAITTLYLITAMLQDEVTVNDSIEVDRSLLRCIQDIIEVDDSFDREGLFGRLIVGDTITLQDLLYISKGFVSHIEDNTDISENVRINAFKNVLLESSIFIRDGLSRDALYTRLLVDPLNVQDNMTRFLFLTVFRLLRDDLNIFEYIQSKVYGPAISLIGNIILSLSSVKIACSLNNLPVNLELSEIDHEVSLNDIEHYIDFYNIPSKLTLGRVN